MLKKTFTICLFSALFVQCKQDVLETPSVPKTTTSIQALAVPAPTMPSYVLMGTNVTSKSLEIHQAIQQLGATETGGIPKLNLMFVKSASPNFISTMEALGVTVGLDFRVVSALSEKQTKSIVTQAATQGNTNPLFSLQWGLSAISAPQAWALGYKGKGVRVAVLDVGMYLNHPDLAVNINKTLSHNFVPLTGENNPNDASFTLSPLFSHATHVAGIIAAADNGIGVVGVAPEAEIMAVKVLSDEQP